MSTPPVTDEYAQSTATDVGGIVVRTALDPATVLAGRYRVERLIGEGGMGDVYLATHLKIDKPVAIKVLAPEQMRRPRTVSRFLQEAKAASKIRHDNVVDITDFGEAEGCAFFVMEYLDGEDLHHLLKRETRISLARAQAIAAQLLGGLAAAHEAGIIHRDIKPHNCFISPRKGNPEFVKVIDFGIAKLRDGSEEQLTRTGAIMGTAEYMSPEQGQGLELDGRSDLYSVGVIVYRMLTGRVPFRGGNPMAILYQHIHGELVPPSVACPEADLSPEVDALVARALAKEPADRFATASEFAAAVTALDPDARAATRKPGRSRTSMVVAGLVLVAVVVGVGGLVWSMLSNPGEATADDPQLAAADQTDPKAPVHPDPDEPTEVDDAPADEPSEAANAGASPPTPAAGLGAASGDSGSEEPSRDTDGATATTAPATDSGAPADAPGPKLQARRSSRRLDAGFDRVASKVKACGKKAGLFPGEKITVDAKIAPGGKVTSVKVKGAHAAAGKTCIVSAVKKAKFDEASRTQSATHRFSM